MEPPYRLQGLDLDDGRRGLSPGRPQGHSIPMELTFLGTGAAMPTGDRFQSGIVLGESDRRLLVDCGSGILHRLQQSGIGYEAIDTVLLTHHHLDHVSDLMPLLKARWLAGEESMVIAGPTGTPALIEGLLETHDYMQDRIDLELRVIEPGSFEIAGFEVQAMEAIHSLQCLAYRFDGMVTISGDTEPSEAVAELADGSALLVHDCAFPDDVEVSNHTRPSELGLLLAEVEVGRVYLTHLYPHCSGREQEMIDSVSEAFSGTVRVANDLQTVRVSRS